ncbi:MAG: VCBS repeat-containing protein [Planctomycetota bacterium]|nr:VCBS repeat-containing protein [Planctomycetota bacterium]
MQPSVLLGGVVGMVALAGEVNGQIQKIPEFEPAVVIGVGSFPWGIAAGDALGPPLEPNDLDGYPEIAVAVGQLNLYRLIPGDWTGETGQVVVFRNTQNWTNPADGLDFAQVIELDEVHPNTISADVKWADMDGDDRLDLVISATTHFDSSSAGGAWGIYVYRYAGGVEPFEFLDYEPTTYPVRGLTVADFDNDGDMDVAAAVDLLEESLPEFARDYISIIKNDGTGHLLPEDLYDLASDSSEPTTAVVAGLFDKTPGGATLPDLFTSRWDWSDGVSMTNLDGTSYSMTFTAPSCASWNFTDIAVGRFTSGKLVDDVVGLSGDGTLSVLHGDGNAGFIHDCSGGNQDDIYLSTSGGAPLTLVPGGLDVGHLNAGTKQDIVVATGGDAGNATATILLGNGDGTFQYNRLNGGYFIDLGVLAHRPLRITIADLDQDGFGDIISSNHGETINDVGTISVLINTFELISLP